MHRRHLILSMIVVCLLQTGCYKFAWFRPVDEKKPIIMFDRYKVVVDGGVIDTSLLINLDCDVAFVKRIPESAPADTIPVLIIDSLCLRAECLNEDLCLLSEDAAKLSEVFEGSVLDSARQRWRTDDLWTLNGVYKPGRFDYSAERIRLPDACLYQTILAVIYARLLDRSTGDLIASESREIPCVIKRYKRLRLIMTAVSSWVGC